MKDRDSKRKETKAKPAKAHEMKTSTQDVPDKELTATGSEIEPPAVVEPELPASSATFEDGDREAEQDVKVEFEEPQSSFVISEQSAQTVEEGQREPGQESFSAVSTFTAQPEASIGEGGRFSLVYVNTPVQELVKRKIEIDFETFSTISIGRSPENVIVVPDAGVSRSHAELSRDGNRIIIKDLQSSNGTYVYDGKEFQKVQDIAEIRPNSLLKLGTGTILRLVTD